MRSVMKSLFVLLLVAAMTVGSFSFLFGEAELCPKIPGYKLIAYDLIGNHWVCCLYQCLVANAGEDGVAQQMEVCEAI